MNNSIICEDPGSINNRKFISKLGKTSYNYLIDGQTLCWKNLAL